MLRVGLTGGLASGKSFVGKALAELGCHLLSADELGHQVLEPGGEAYDVAIREFGRGILDEEGRINRRRLAQIVFEDPAQLARLNAVVHPPVLAREERWMAECAARDPDGIAVLEAAILIETGTYKRFDRLILAVCDEQQQMERAIRRDKLTGPEVRSRLARQMPLAEKVKYADYVIDTSGDKENTLQQIRAVYDNLLRGIQYGFPI
jgi:dephospho-CoA kinase